MLEEDSARGTFCALRLFMNSWRWEGVPWYLRSGQVPGRNGDRSRRGIEGAAAGGCLPMQQRRRVPVQLSALSYFAEFRHRLGRSRQARRPGVRRHSAGAVVWSKNSQARNLPTSAYWAMPWRETVRSSLARMRLRLHGPWLILSFQDRHHQVCPSARQLGTRKRPTQSSLPARTGTIPCTQVGIMTLTDVGGG